MSDGLCGRTRGWRRFAVFSWMWAFALLAGCSKTESPSAPAPASPSVPAEENNLTGAESDLLKEDASEGFKTVKFPFVVFADASIPRFTPEGWMGDFKDVRADLKHPERPHSGATCARFEYLPGASQNSKWAGVYWLYPGNAWGARRGGYNLSGAQKLTFWARGEKGGEVLQEVKMGGIGGKYRDSDTAGIGPITLGTEWQKFEINLTGVDLSYISGGFCWSTNLESNKNGCTFYLDDIIYE